MLPLSHDEVVHGKGSLLSKMPGDGWQKRANLRLLFGYQYGLPGKKLLFMGSELGLRGEWDHDSGLDWGLLEDESHAGIARWVSDLNRAYRDRPALYDLDTEPEGFAWLRHDDADTGVLSFLRRSRAGEVVVVVCNFTPVPRYNVIARRPIRRLLEGAPQQRRHELRGQRDRQPRWGGRPTRALARLAENDHSDRSSPRMPRAHSHQLPRSGSRGSRRKGGRCEFGRVAPTPWAPPGTARA